MRINKSETCKSRNSKCFCSNELMINIKQKMFAHQTKYLLIRYGNF